MSKILVTGSNGQLGNEIRELANSVSDSEFLFHDVDTLDLSNFEKTENFIFENKPDFLVNCAAYTAVDKAEEEYEKAELLNAAIPGFLAELAVRYNFRLLHISTDYVFGGRNFRPYDEEDNTDPQTNYGRTKLNGEKAVIRNYPGAIIIRTSWLYSFYGSNFVKTMLKYGSERDELKVIFDQIGTPTNAADLASAILQIIHLTVSNEQNWTAGIYHFSNEGVCSWYDFALEIMEFSNLKARVIPIESKDYPLPATRPFYSVLNKRKIKLYYNLTIPHWKTSLHKVLKKLVTD